jgi:hypothetical protein
MIDVANKWDEGYEKCTVKVIANHMKKSTSWNKDTVKMT